MFRARHRPMIRFKRTLDHLLLACFVVAVALVAVLAMVVAFAKECLPGGSRGMGRGAHANEDVGAGIERTRHRV